MADVGGSSPSTPTGVVRMTTSSQLRVYFACPIARTTFVFSFKPRGPPPLAIVAAWRTAHVAVIASEESRRQIAGSASGYTGDRERSGAVAARVLCVGLWAVDLVDGMLQHRLDVDPFALG